MNGKRRWIRRWITSARESDCAGCLGPILPGQSVLVSERGKLCASCGCDLEIQDDDTRDTPSRTPLGTQDF